jgi:glycosyltransferase involved in cell wall biosynthesis
VTETGQRQSRDGTPVVPTSSRTGTYADIDTSIYTVISTETRRRTAQLGAAKPRWMGHVVRDGEILVLTTNEMDYWLSFQEIVPSLERVWARIGQSGREAVRMLRVPLAPEVEQQLISSSSRVKRIVMIARSPETIRLAVDLRQRMNVAAPMIIYVHGDAIDGFHFFGALPDFLTEMDALVVTCEAEARATRCCFPNAQVTVIPFPLVDGFKVNGEGDLGHEAARLAYVGRISEQKNLHTLLLALWVLRTSYDHAPKISLDVYGTEDGLGTPHSGLRYPDYGTYLQRLAESLGVHDIVRWHGFKQRDWIFEHVHTQPHVFVSPTLHSDENFGSSLLASLVNGHQAVTTAWGGHHDFEEWFPEQLSLVPVHRSTRGPIVDPVLLATAVLRAANRRSTAIVDQVALDRGRVAFSEGSVTTRTLDLLSRPGGKPLPLEKSPSLRYIDERRAYYGGAKRIYLDYADPVLQIFYEAYGMKEPITFQERSSYVLAPWTSYSDGVLRVDDPHRGQQSFPVGVSTSESPDVTLCPSMEMCRLPERLVKTLVTQGYAFVLARGDSTTEASSLVG